jgi:hypothetical protein
MVTNGWDSEPPVCGVDDGVPDRTHRIAGLGNAVVPAIPEWLGMLIQEHYQRERSSE